MNRHILLASSAVSVFLLAAVALAHDEDRPKARELRSLDRAIDRLEEIELPDAESRREHPSSFFAGPHGEARIISGEVSSIASTTMAVRVWGLTLTVNIANARFHPAGTTASSLRVGDKVNVKGVISKDTGVIEASLVNARSHRVRLTDELSNQIRRLIERLRELQAKAGLPLTPLLEPPATTTSQ